MKVRIAPDVGKFLDAANAARAQAAAQHKAAGERLSALVSVHLASVGVSTETQTVNVDRDAEGWFYTVTPKTPEE